MSDEEALRQRLTLLYQEGNTNAIIEELAAFWRETMEEEW